MTTLKITFEGKNGKLHSFATKKVPENCNQKEIYEAIRLFFEQEKAKGNPYFEKLVSVKLLTRKEERILQCYRSKSGFEYIAEGEKKVFKRRRYKKEWSVSRETLHSFFVIG